jgi:hypothetical protein
MQKNLMSQLTQAVLVLGFNNFSGADLSAFAAAVITAMTGNAYFPTPLPAIADVQQLLTDYNTAAAAAESRDRNAVVTKTLARLALIEGLQNLGRYCMSTANGNRQMLESSGYQLSKKGNGQPTPEMPAPANLQLTDGPLPYSVGAAVDGNPLFKSLTFQYSETDPATGTNVWISEFTTATSYIFFNLKSATRYWFRVVAVGTRNQVKFSDIKSRLVQ